MRTQLCTCVVCGKTFEFEHGGEKGYDTLLCGPMCDGVRAGRAVARQEIIDALNRIQRWDMEARNWSESMEENEYGDWMKTGDVAEALGMELDTTFDESKGTCRGFKEPQA